MNDTPTPTPAGERAPDHLLAGFQQKAEHAANCLQWLSGLGCKVLSIHLYHHLERPEILVASGALLMTALPADDIAWIGQRRSVYAVADAYLCLRLGCSVRWEQPQDLSQVAIQAASLPQPTRPLEAL